jgi:hypothetical protein
MNWTYTCPHCNALLNPDDKIVLCAQGDGRTLLVGFHPQPGNYEVELPPGEEMAVGTRWNFVCPACNRSLVSELSDDLCALDVHTGEGTYRIFFSRTAGEQATFVVSAEGMLSDYGIHTDRYLERMVHAKYMR